MAKPRPVFTAEQRDQIARLDGTSAGRYSNHPPTHFDRAGEPLTLGEWAILNSDFEYKVVAQSDVPPVWLSTVWLGLDHGCFGFFDGGSEPLIFETIGFPLKEGGGGPADYTEVFGPWRWSSEAVALRAHEVIVTKLTDVFREPRQLTPGDLRALLGDVSPLDDD